MLKSANVMFELVIQSTSICDFARESCRINVIRYDCGEFLLFGLFQAHSLVIGPLLQDSFILGQIIILKSAGVILF
jgi:hypothetical protein